MAVKEDQDRHFLCLHCMCVVSEKDLLPDGIHDQACPMASCTGAGIGHDLHNAESELAKALMGRRWKGRDCRTRPITDVEREAWPKDKGESWDRERFFARQARGEQKVRKAKFAAKRCRHCRKR